MNQIIEDHFMNPRNVGQMKNSDIRINIRSSVCSDIVNIDVLMNSDGKIKTALYHAYGCSTIIATASIISSYIIGRNFEELRVLTRECVVDMLGELEPRERHCIDLGYSLIRLICAEIKEWRTSNEMF